MCELVYLALLSSAVACRPAATRVPTDDAWTTKFAESTHGMVAAAHPLATQAGVEVLTAGGNAFDAAVAVATTLNVVEPMMSGIGGYGTILIYDARQRRVRFLNSSGRIPRAVNSDAFRWPTVGFERNRRGAKAVSTPGNANAWEVLWRAYGSRDWASLFEHAIGAAESGYIIGPQQARMIADAFPEFPAHARRFYGRDGSPLREGDRLVQRDLARSLRLIAEGGARAFYIGPIAAAIDSTMRVAGGFLSAADLAADTAEWWEPISIDYRGVRVFSASPPANTFDALARLGMMARFDPVALGHHSPDYLHTYAEVTKLGFWLRLRYAGDPDIAPPPIHRLLSKQFLDSLAALVDPGRARTFAPPAPAQSSTHTTHFVIADRWGNIVSATQTIGNTFGSRIMPEGTGVWLNNSLAYSTFDPKGNPMDAFPRRYKLSGDVPAIVLRNGRPWVALGTPGGHTIGQIVPQILMNAIDFRMRLDETLSAPRISFAEPDLLLVESTVPEAARLELLRRGHRVRPVTALGNAHALMIEYDMWGRRVRFIGAADRRGEGTARGP